jgi:hypothetical protein
MKHLSLAFECFALRAFEISRVECLIHTDYATQ